MQKHTNRVVIAAVLIAAGVLGGFFVFDAHRRAGIAAATDDALAARIGRMITTAKDIASTQQAYVAPGQPDRPWLERGAMLLQQFGEDAAALRPLLQSTDAPAAIDQIERHFKSIVVIDGNARQDLQQAQNLLAADLIFSEARDTINALVDVLRHAEASEHAAFAAQRAALERQQWTTTGVVAALWIVGLIALVPTGSRGDANTAFVSTLSLHSPSNASAAATTVDLGAAAGVCGALARTTDTAALRAVLGRAAEVLDAHGVIVWMGAGEQLFPALSHGYDERLLEQLGPIPRDAANATAESWRTAQMRTVTSDVVSNGAVVAPIAGASGCVGVFAAEMRHGREGDEGTRAVAAMIAAQLAAIVSAWPAASAAGLTDSGPLAASSR